MAEPHPRRILSGLAVIAGLACLAGMPSRSAAVTSHPDLSYDIDSPAPGSANRLDLYAPDGSKPGDDRPVVVFVHGGGWRIGDKGNKIADKVNLFTGAGYVFASVNYRLSPATGDPENPDPDRIMFPAHPHDVGEAVGWLDRHVAKYGGDPTRMILIGHSAGAQIVSLVSTDPRYVEAYGVEPWQIIGTVSLDSDAFDITEEATQTGNIQNRDLIWNAFGTPDENAVSGSWLQASANRWASPKDPDFLLATSQNPNRLAKNQAMASALGQDPDGVLSLPYDHEGINEMLGNSSDTAGETTAVTNFVSHVIAASKDPKAKLVEHPAKKIRTAEHKAKVRFRFSSTTKHVKFECRLDGGKFKRCGSPKTLRVGAGAHKFRVHAVTDRGRPGPNKVYTFKVVKH